MLTSTEFTLEVPLDHARPNGETIEVFARGVTAEGGEKRPWLVFLQGGPGMHGPRLSARPAWLEGALAQYRVLLVDQRGTGRSTPVGRVEEVPGADPAAKAAYLTHFRADSIVADCEAFRVHLGVDRWTVLGQSFGGFCTLNYLSRFPDSLAAALFTGGLPVVGRPVAEVYAATYEAMRQRSRRWADRFPESAQRLRAAVLAADAGRVRTAAGTALSGRRLRSVGGILGMEHGEEELRDLLDLDPESLAFATDASAQVPFIARDPLYALLHEACYADGGVTGWAAEATLPADFAEDRGLLTGEHIFGWHFTEDPELAPWAEVAEELARIEWPRLYDPDALAAVDLPVAAMVYTHDPFVLRDLQLQTAASVGSIKVIERDYEHNALRIRGPEVLDPLLEAIATRR